ncbi:MAG: hypothetical protein OWU33_09895 [Firmicutes bacterium]|nr:hypothetical protein [Bacillota bacterium]
MSTAQSRYREDKPKGHRPEPRADNGRSFRRVLGVSAAVVAVGIWQLNPLIKGLGSVDKALAHVEPVRAWLILWIHIGYRHASAVILPWIHHWHV